MRGELRFPMFGALICAFTLALVAAAAQANATAVPRLFTTFTLRGSETINHFGVRPAEAITDSADGGELKFHWKSWTATKATGYGRAYPDHGSWSFTVVASRPVTGDFPFPVFTRLSFVNHVPGRGIVHNPLGLAYVIGNALGWEEVSWMDNSASGATPVNPPSPGGDIR